MSEQDVKQVILKMLYNKELYFSLDKKPNPFGGSGKYLKLNLHHRNEFGGTSLISSSEIDI